MDATTTGESIQAGSSTMIVMAHTGPHHHAVTMSVVVNARDKGEARGPDDESAKHSVEETTCREGDDVQVKSA